LNIQRNSHAPKLGTRNRYRESSEFDIETSNRFSPLSEADESLNEQLQQNSDNKRAKILLIGNSHIDRIRTENVLSNCLVHKYVGYTFDEMFEKIEELDQDYDCILLHVFTNNLRNVLKSVMNIFQLFPVIANVPKLSCLYLSLQ